MANTVTVPANTQPLPSFNVAQTFEVDPTLAPNNDAIAITSINIYFKYMPQANNNSSGIQNPGVTMYIANTIYGVPIINTNMLRHVARVEWNQIQTSSDASAPTNFQFVRPVRCEVGQTYAFVLAYDGNEPFVPWTAETGQYYVGTRIPYSVASSGLVGSLFEYSSAGDSTNVPTVGLTQGAYQNGWQPLVGAALTFDIYAARYAINGVPVSFSNNVSALTPIYGNNVSQTYNANTGVLTYTYPTPAMELIRFQFALSTVQSYIGAQKVFQNCAPYPGVYSGGSQSVTVSCNTANVIVTANTLLPNGSNFQWNTIFPSLNVNIPYIVLQDVSGPNIRRVVQIISNTQIQIDEPPTFTNSIATFLITPCATIDSVQQAAPYGIIDQFLILTQSNANSSVRFTSNNIQSVSGYPTGTGYSNSDVCYVQGFENVTTALQGTFPAIGNVSTNSTGGIVNVYFSNAGCGFSNTANVTFIFVANGNANTTSNSSAGSGATLTANVGCLIQTEYSTNLFQNCVVMNVNIDDVTPFFNIDAPLGTNYTLQLSSLYYMQANTQVSSGYAFYVSPVAQTANVTMSQINPLVSNTPMAFVSRSNEFSLCYANGALNNQVNAASQYSNNILLYINTNYTGLNDDYITVRVLSQPSLEFGHYIINNSYFKEYTTSGNAWAKHITTLINFNSFAEDLRVYLTVYQPINTSFQVFAKIQNQNDVEQFPLEDWTQLVVVSGGGQVSSLVDQTDYVEVGYGFPQFSYQPNTALVSPANYTFANAVTVNVGTATTTSNVGNTIIQTTSGFANLTVGVANGALIRCYNPLFPNTEFFIAEVVSVTSDTQIVVDYPITGNTNLGGNPAFVSNTSITNPLALDVISLPHQAFNNFTNSNVVRYYNGSQMRYDGYNNLMLKVVFQSSAFSYIPQLNSIRALGVTA